MAVPGVAQRKEKSFLGVFSPGAGVCYLRDLKTGNGGVITALHGDEQFRCKMLSLGVVPGTRISVVNGGDGQPFILKVGDSRLILSWGMAQKVAVSAVTYS